MKKQTDYSLENKIQKLSRASNKKRKKSYYATIVGFMLTATIVLAGTTYFADKSEYIKRRAGTSDSEIAKDPDGAIHKAQENLQSFGDWRSDLTIKTGNAGEIVRMLLVLAKAKEAKNLAVGEILADYRDLISQFPDSHESIEALCRIVELDKDNGLEYSEKILEESGNHGSIVAFYERLIKSCIERSDSQNAEKYVKLFIDKYASGPDGLKLMAGLVNKFRRFGEKTQLYRFIDSNVAENPDSSIYCAIFKQRILLLKSRGAIEELLGMANSACQKFGGTKLASCAMGVLADEKYQQDQFVEVVETFRADLFAENKPESTVAEDIDKILAIYSTNTLRAQGVDFGKVYEALAMHSDSLGKKIVGVHCYKQSAKARGFSIEVFKDGATAGTEYCNTTAENEIWFWKGFFAVEEGDLMTAAMLYGRFLKADSSSILAAKAYYDIASARVALGQYEEAKEAITKAKKISPCEPVIEMERALNDSTGHMGTES